MERWSIRLRTSQELTLLALALAVTACAAELANEGRSQGAGGRWCTIVFGVILPSAAGGDAAPGTASRFGYEAASEAVNSAGGVAVGAHRCLVDIRYADAAGLGGDTSNQVDHFATQLGVDFLISAFPDAGFAYSEPHGIPMLAGGSDALTPGRADALCHDPGNGAAAAASDGSAKAACAAAVLQLGLFQQAIEAAGRLDPEAVRRELLALGATEHERRD